MEDTEAFGSGTYPGAADRANPANPTLPPPQGSTGQADAKVPQELDRADEVTAFIGSPLFLEPAQLRMDNTVALLALAVDGAVQKASFKLLALAYSQQEAEAI